MDEAEPASFIAARGNIEDDESVAGDRLGIIPFSIHKKKIIIILYVYMYLIYVYINNNIS